MVVAIGNRFRGDDAVGPLVLDALRSRLPADVRVSETDGDASRLVLAWDGAVHCVAIDAVVSGTETGSIHEVDFLARSRDVQSASSSHLLGLGEAVELGRALERLPERLSLVGIEGAVFEQGAPMSPSVQSAIEPAAAMVLAMLGVTDDA
jgi:hydrogenase maturation protease